MLRIFISLVICATVVGCSSSGNDAQVNVSDDGVTVDAPGVHVETGAAGTNVDAPGVRVDVNERGTEVVAPGVDVDVEE
jgi:hypothetical protein